LEDRGAGTNQVLLCGRVAARYDPDVISTRDLSDLPAVPALRRLMQSVAALDAVMSPDWESRYFSFDARWGRGEQMGSMRDGSGGHVFALFDATGCWLKGFDHECPMSPYGTVPPRVLPGVLDAVPPEFAACLTEPAFDVGATTFCVWRRTRGRRWHRGPVEFPRGTRDPDGSAGLLRFYDGRPGTYRAFAESYYERPVPLAAVRSVYRHEPLDEATVGLLNEGLRLADLRDDLAEIGYPAA
jgi:hypothetical protein